MLLSVGAHAAKPVVVGSPKHTETLLSFQVKGDTGSTQLLDNNPVGSKWFYSVQASFSENNQVLDVKLIVRHLVNPDKFDTGLPNAITKAFRVDLRTGAIQDPLVPAIVCTAHPGIHGDCLQKDTKLVVTSTRVDQNGLRQISMWALVVVARHECLVPPTEKRERSLQSESTVTCCPPEGGD